MNDLEITKVTVGPKSNNAYLLRCPHTGQALLVDAADEPATLLELLRRRTGGALTAVVTTHSHADHWQALREVVDATGAVTLAGRHDADEIPVPVDVRLDDGDQVPVGGATLDVIHLAGHTPGSVALACTDTTGATHLFTGDSLFPGGVGRTASDDDFRSLIHDVTTKLFDRYGDATLVHPGHGADTVLGAERPYLDEWRARGW